nr:phosphoenolpyruvate carboxylase 1 [Tanacetum cinerariifolium]
MSLEEVFEALMNQIVNLVLTAHPTHSVCRSFLQKHGRIWDWLAQLYAKDITSDGQGTEKECCEAIRQYS